MSKTTKPINFQRRDKNTYTQAAAAATAKTTAAAHRRLQDKQDRVNEY